MNMNKDKVRYVIPAEFVITLEVPEDLTVEQEENNLYNRVHSMLETQFPGFASHLFFDWSHAYEEKRWKDWSPKL